MQGTKTFQMEKIVCMTRDLKKRKHSIYLGKVCWKKFNGKFKRISKKKKKRKRKTILGKKRSGKVSSNTYRVQ